MREMPIAFFQVAEWIGVFSRKRRLHALSECGQCAGGASLDARGDACAERLQMLSIVQYPDPLLSQVCEPCDPSDKDLRRLAKQMAKAMYDNDGCGIAAPQVGVLKRLVVIDCDEDYGHDPLVLINPTIEELRGEPVTDEEGCLSCPGVSVPVARRPWARVRYYDFDGELWELEGDGLLGRCLQHEIDHLEGRTLFESCDPLLRIGLLQEYKAAKAAGAKPGETSAKGKVR